MAGFGTDTTQLSLNVRLPDGSRIELVGLNDGVNGYDWSAALYDPAEQMKHLDVDVEERTFEDGEDDDEDDGPDLGPDSVGVKLTRGQVNAWAGYELDGDQLDQLEEAIPNSSIPEAIGTITEQFRDECVGPDGEFLPHGRCDTCGAPCDEHGCTTSRDHQVAIDPTSKENHA